MDETSIAEWDTAAWQQWSTAMHADPHGPNPSVPAWMQPLLTRWHVDFSAPLPAVAQLWPTGHDWFADPGITRMTTLLETKTVWHPKGV